MKMIQTDAHMRLAATEAALQRYKMHSNTPDRQGWSGTGKCPVNEFNAIMCEIAGAVALKRNWKNLCLFSTDTKDWKKPDLGTWDFKSGSRIYKSDIAKGVRNVMWLTAHNTGKTFYCNINTCTDKIHLHYADKVEVRGWSTVNDLEHMSDFGYYYKPQGMTFRTWTR